MAGTRRGSSSQSKHDREVKKTAKEFEDKGYEVNADIQGYSKPKTVLGYRPDVAATKGNKKVIVEVETPDSVNIARDKAQQAAFSRAARKPTVKFIRRVTK